MSTRKKTTRNRTAKPTAKQLAARKRFIAAVKAGKFRKGAKKSKRNAGGALTGKARKRGPLETTFRQHAAHWYAQGLSSAQVVARLKSKGFTAAESKRIAKSARSVSRYAHRLEKESRKKNKTVIKAKRVTILNLRGLSKKKNPPRRPNITSASDLAYAGTAKKETRDGVKGWSIGGKFFAGSATARVVKLTSSAYLDLKHGDVWVRKAKNPKRRNVAQGAYYGDGSFHPYRSSPDYDPARAGETGGRPKRTKSKKAQRTMRKASVTARHRAATKAKRKHTSRLAGRSLSRVPKGAYKKRNVAQGAYYGDGSFHPYRSSPDYDPARAGETGGKPKRTKSKAAKRSMRKASATARHRATTRARKATTTRLASRSLQRVPKGAYKKRRNAARQIIYEGPRFKVTYDPKTEWYYHYVDGKLRGKSRTGQEHDVQPVRGRKRRNPNAATQKAKQQFKEFHGYDSGSFPKVYWPKSTPAQGLSALGNFKEFVLADGRKVVPQQGTTYLARDLNGKLHLGTTLKGGVLTNEPKGDFGKIKRLEYVARKPHLGSPNKTIWFHKAGEENGKLPSLRSDGAGGLLITGGDYYITPEGIRN